MMRGLIVLSLIFITGCAGTKKDEVLPPEPVEPANQPAFENGVKALDREQYSEAARIFDRLLVVKPASEQDLVTTFNSGAAYEGMGNCQRASERYREVTRGSAGKFRRLEAVAFFRLSLMYECLGQDVKAITALLDARKRGSNLSFATLHAEIPARLAAAYARIGNRKKALEYFAQASKGLKRIVSSESGRKQQDILAQSLFLMGQLNPGQRRAETEPGAYLLGLSMQQPHLLQAVELNHPLWSKKAHEDLQTAYENLWKFQFDDETKRNAFYIQAMQVTRELKRLRMPNENAAATSVFALVEATERRLNTEIARNAESTKLTPEAQRNQSLRKEGKLVDPSAPAKKSPIRRQQ